MWCFSVCKEGKGLRVVVVVVVVNVCVVGCYRELKGSDEGVELMAEKGGEKHFSLLLLLPLTTATAAVAERISAARRIERRNGGLP